MSFVTNTKKKLFFEKWADQSLRSHPVSISGNRDFIFYVIWSFSNKVLNKFICRKRRILFLSESGLFSRFRFRVHILCIQVHERWPDTSRNPDFGWLKFLVKLFFFGFCSLYHHVCCLSWWTTVATVTCPLWPGFSTVRTLELSQDSAPWPAPNGFWSCCSGFHTHIHVAERVVVPFGDKTVVWRLFHACLQFERHVVLFNLLYGSQDEFGNLEKSKAGCLTLKTNKIVSESIKIKKTDCRKNKTKFWLERDTQFERHLITRVHTNPKTRPKMNESMNDKIGHQNEID